MMNHIGIDATALPREPVGAGTYIIELISALCSQEDHFKFTIIAHHSSSELLKADSKTSVNWILLPDKSPAYRLVWEQFNLPSLVHKSGIHLLHSLHYTRPVRLPCRSVVTFHDMTFLLYPRFHTLPKRFFFPVAIRLAARMSDHIIAVSETTLKDAIQLLGISKNKISVVLQGVGESFHPINDKTLLESTRRRYNLPEKFILSVGSIEPRKNLPVLLGAYKNLLERGLSLPLVISGPKGWHYRQFFDRVKELQLEDKLILTGYIPSSDLPVVYNLADIFVYPSLYEGFGLPPLEAMASGTPVITTSGSAMQEHVGDAGLLVSPKNENELANAIATLISDPKLQRTLINKGLERAAKFTWNRTAQETLKIYHQVLSRK